MAQIFNNTVIGNRTEPIYLDKTFINTDGSPFVCPQVPNPYILLTVSDYEFAALPRILDRYWMPILPSGTFPETRVVKLSYASTVNLDSRIPTTGDNAFKIYGLDSNYHMYYSCVFKTSDDKYMTIRYNSGDATKFTFEPYDFHFRVQIYTDKLPSKNCFYDVLVVSGTSTIEHLVNTIRRLYNSGEPIDPRYPKDDNGVPINPDTLPEPKDIFVFLDTYFPEFTIDMKEQARSGGDYRVDEVMQSVTSIPLFNIKTVAVLQQIQKLTLENVIRGGL